MLIPTATLTVRYASPARVMEARLEIAPLAALLAAVGSLLANLAVLMLGSLTFIVFMLQPVGLTALCIALAGLMLACMAEWRVLNALHRLDQLAVVPTQVWAVAGA